MKKHKKKEKKRRYRLFYLLLLLLITTLSLSVSSYAWFTTNRLVRVDLLNVNVRAQGGIEISVDGTNWKSSVSVDDIITASDTYPTNTNQIPQTLEAVSTVGKIENGKITMYHGNAVNNATGNYVLETTRSIEVASAGENSTGKFITFDLFLKTNNNTQLYLTPESNATYGGNKSVGIENAVRFAFVEEGTTFTGAPLGTIQSMTTSDQSKVHIWEPNYDTHTEYGIENARDVYQMNITSPSEPLNYDGVLNEIPKIAGVTTNNASENKYPMYFQRVNIDYYTKNNFDNNVQIFSINSGITKIKVYMWIEGQDVDCENNAAIGNVALNLSFSTNPA